MCLFSRLSVGQGLCCRLPCSWLQHSPPPRAGAGPELAISEAGAAVLVTLAPCKPGRACPCIGLLLGPTGLCCNGLSVQGVLVPWSFVSSLRSQTWLLAALAPWKGNLEKARTAEVLPCLCSDRRVGMGHCNAHDAILTVCKLEFFTDLNWWNVSTTWVVVVSDP